MSFYRERAIKATRKPHFCEGCRSRIAAGQPALYIAVHSWANVYPFFGHFHPVCREAECALNELHRCYADDEWLSLMDLEDEDRSWLREKHPEAFANLFPTLATQTPPVGG